MGLAGLAAADYVAGRAVRFEADEQVVYGIHHLAIVEGGFGHGDGFDWALACEDFGDELGQIRYLKWKQLAVPAAGIRIYPDDLLAVQIFEGVGDQAVLAERDDQIIRTE